MISKIMRGERLDYRSQDRWRVISCMELPKPVIKPILINSIIFKKRFKSYPILIFSYHNRHKFASNPFTKKGLNNIKPEILKNLFNLPQNLKLIYTNLLRLINQN